MKARLILVAMAMMASMIFSISGCGGGGGTSTSAAPTPPTGVTAVAADGQVTISWNAVSGATSYNLYWSVISDITIDNSTKISDVRSAYVHKILANTLTYYYVVTAVNPDGESDVSAKVSATPTVATTVPSAPVGVTASAGDEQAVIGWNAVSGATSYNIYWSTISGVTKSDNKITDATIPYSHTGLTNETTYYYVVAAENSLGESGISTEISATPVTPTSVPSAPSGVTASAGDAQATIGWSAASGARSYNIYWSTTSGVTKSDNKIAGTTSPYSHTGLTNGTTYHYVVTAENSLGEGEASAEVSAKPAAVAGGNTLPSEGIVFVSVRDGWNGIWVMNTDGSNPRRLSSVAKSYYGDNYPSSSPDGSKIVFTREDTGIVVLDSTGEKIVKNFSYGDDPRYTTWSYNGKIYFTGWDATHQYDFIYSINSDGTGLAQATPPFSDFEPNDHHPSISPDGLNLLFFTNRTGNVGIAKMSIVSGSTTYLTYTGGVLGETVIAPAQHPTWSPDGTKIAFAAYPGYPDFTRKEQIYVMNADGSQKVPLTSETEANCRFPSWSPDGTKIVFQKDYPSFSNPTEVWIMNSDGSGGKALTDRNVTNYDAQPVFIKKPR